MKSPPSRTSWTSTQGHWELGSRTRRRARNPYIPRLADLQNTSCLSFAAAQSHSFSEIWLPRNDCGDQRVEQVAEAQKPATATQSKSNKNEYVTLGHLAKRLGIEPSALVPTCEEYQSILDAGPDSIERMLALIGKRSGERLVEELHRYPNQESEPVVVAYGGALHNDAEPTSDHKDYSYGPRLLDETQGNYLELDLIVREFVKDTAVWQRQPWYQALKKNRDSSRTLVYQWGLHSFALVFPTSSK